MGLFQKFEDKSVFENIDPQFLDKNGFWVPVTYRSRVIVYSNERVENVTDKVNEGDIVKVKVIEIDKQGRIKLSMKAVDN